MLSVTKPTAHKLFIYTSDLNINKPDSRRAKSIEEGASTVNEIILLVTDSDDISGTSEPANNPISADG